MVKLMGDGTLVEFGSVVDAVKCALAIQRAVKAEARPDAKGIVLRIGVNLGDIIVDGEDIYGDGVNVAARLEPLAEPGGVCVASIVQESVGSRIDINFRDGGHVEVKNIERPIRVWKWHPDHDRPAASAQSAAAEKGDAGAKPEAPSIAVLPFDNMSGDPEQEYFSDGITEDIITDLSKIAGLLVIARNSSFAYKKKSVDIRSVGRELGVRSVLEGSIRRAGSRVRINAQLIDAASGGHIWAERYDRDLTDIFAVQDEVTRCIVDALKVKLTPSEKARIGENPTDNMEAHDLFLKGRDMIQRGNLDREVFEASNALFERAIALDPNYSQPLAALGLNHIMDFQNRWSAEPDGSLARSAELAAKAVAADANEPLAHVISAIAAMTLHEHDAARQAVERALTLSPNHAMALNARGTMAIYAGDPASGIPDIERAMRLDPAFAQQYLHFLGMAHFMLGHFETAATMFRERIILVPKTDMSRSALAATLGHLGQAEEARKIWAELKAINPKYSLAGHLRRMPFRNPADLEKYAAGIAKAGIAD